MALNDRVKKLITINSKRYPIIKWMAEFVEEVSISASRLRREAKSLNSAADATIERTLAKLAEEAEESG